MRVHLSLVRWLSLVIGMVFFSGVLALASRVLAQDDNGAGLVVSGQASAKDVGLPIYPGAAPHKDTAENSNAVRLGLWGGGAGFKLAVLKMESKDAPAKVADFYEKALAKYGKVLHCTSGGANPDGSNDSRALTCGDDKPDKSGTLLKSGTKEKQHIVDIEPYGTGTTFALVYVWAKGE